MIVEFAMVLGSVSGDSPTVIEQVMRWAKVNETWELYWVGFGLIAQATFFARWLVQWAASERRNESHMPDMFWWLSLIGASMMLAYFIGRGEPVGALGQCIGWTVYSRNLYLIKKKRRHLEIHVEDGEAGTASQNK